MSVKIGKKVTGMIKDNQKVFNRLHLLVDAIVVIVSYLLAW